MTEKNAVKKLKNYLAGTQSLPCQQDFLLLPIPKRGIFIFTLGWEE